MQNLVFNIEAIFTIEANFNIIQNIKKVSETFGDMCLNFHLVVYLKDFIVNCKPQFFFSGKPHFYLIVYKLQSFVCA